MAGRGRRGDRQRAARVLAARADPAAGRLGRGRPASLRARRQRGSASRSRNASGRRPPTRCACATSGPSARRARRTCRLGPACGAARRSSRGCGRGCASSPTSAAASSMICRARRGPIPRRPHRRASCPSTTTPSWPTPTARASSRPRISRACAPATASSAPSSSTASFVGPGRPPSRKTERRILHLPADAPTDERRAPHRAVEEEGRAPALFIAADARLPEVACALSQGATIACCPAPSVLLNKAEVRWQTRIGRYITGAAGSRGARRCATSRRRAASSCARSPLASLAATPPKLPRGAGRRGSSAVSQRSRRRGVARPCARAAWGVYSVQSTCKAGVEKEEQQGEALRQARARIERAASASSTRPSGSAHKKAGIPHFENRICGSKEAIIRGARVSFVRHHLGRVLHGDPADAAGPGTAAKLVCRLAPTARSC